MGTSNDLLAASLGASSQAGDRASMPPVSVAAVRWALGLFVGFGALYAAVGRYALEAFPFAGDEFSTVLQARLFARGLLRAPAPEHVEWLGVDHVVIDSWVRSKYPPGTAALLAAGEHFNAIWIVNPILAVATLAIFWSTARRWLGETPALAGLVALGLAPLFAFHAASFYSHNASVLFLAIAFAAVAGWLRRPVPRGGNGWLVLAGAALGCGFLVRPVDALLFGIAMASLRSIRALVITAVSALPIVLLTFVYQNAQYGSPFVTGYGLCSAALGAAYGPQAAAPALYLGCLVNPLQQWFHLDIARGFCVDWTVPGTAIVALLGAYVVGKEHPARALRSFSIALIVTYVFVLLFTTSDPDDGARSRYLSPLLVPVVFLAAAGFAPACAALSARFGERVRKTVVTLAALFGLAQFANFVQTRVPQVWKREGVFKAAEAQAAPDAVVVVRAKFPAQYARSGPFYDGILYLSPPATTPVEDIAAAYPGRQVWEAFEGDVWHLVKIR